MASVCLSVRPSVRLSLPNVTAADFAAVGPAEDIDRQWRAMGAQQHGVQQQM